MKNQILTPQKRNVNIKSYRKFLRILTLGGFAVCHISLVFGVSPAPDGGYAGGNTAEGQNALFNLSSGSFNTAVGFFSLKGDTTGGFNTAIGAGTLLVNTADQNTATGAAALLSNSGGASNTAHGALALLSNISGSSNTAIGNAALESNTTGDNNTAIGQTALAGNTTGSSNIALGAFSASNVTTAQGVICIAALGANINSSCFIGHIRDVSTQNGDALPVVIDSNSQLGTMSSSRRFKKEIKPMGTASESILSLKPVSFHYKTDSKGTPQFGLIAEQVAEVNSDLVVRDKNGEIYSVRYDAVNAMLLNEFLKEHQTMQDLRKGIAVLTAQLKAQAAQIQKVNTQVELISPAPQIAAKK
jgi:endosialidase-like protein